MGTLRIGPTLWKPYLATKSSALNRVLAALFFLYNRCFFFGFHLLLRPRWSVADVNVRSIRDRFNDHIIAADWDHFGFCDSHASVCLPLLLAHPQMKLRRIKRVGIMKLCIVGFHKLIQQVRRRPRFPRLWKRYF